MPSNFHSITNPFSSVLFYGQDRLSQRHFMMTLLAAFALHALALFAWYLAPKQHVVDIPVRPLNIKLGEGDVISPEEMAAPQPAVGNTAAVENTISRLVRDQNPENEQRAEQVARSMDKAMAALNKAVAPTPGMPMKGAPSAAPKGKSKPFDMRSEGVKVAAPVMPVVAASVHQFVRNDTSPKADIKPSAGVSASAKDAEMIARYEQLISAWIQKFKVYPDEARNSSEQGDTMVRIRIDRRGNIRYWALERSTGSAALDRAAIDMIRRANPVPAVPADYPPAEILEFLVPVDFKLQ